MRLDATSGDAVSIDLKFMSIPSHASQITQWTSVAGGARPIVSRDFLLDATRKDSFILPAQDDLPAALLSDVSDEISPTVPVVGLSRKASRVIDFLFSEGALLGDGKPKGVADFLEHGIEFSEELVAMMAEHNLLRISRNEFGECAYELIPSTLVWQYLFAARDPVSLFHVPSNKMSGNKMHLVCMLLREGWASCVDDYATFAPGQALTFPESCMAKLANLMVCLLQREALWKKGLNHILMGQYDAYYKCLLRKLDLRGWHDVPGFAKLGAQEFQALSNDEPLPPSSGAPPLPPPYVPLAIGDGSEGMDADKDAVTNAEKDSVDVPAPPPAPAVFGIAPIRFKNVNVYFDNFSSGSAYRRALCLCTREAHDPKVTQDIHESGRCEKDVSLARFGNQPKEAAAFLIAWYYVGEDCHDKATHLAKDPSPASVQEVLDKL